MYKRKSTTGSKIFDSALDDIYHILNTFSPRAITAGGSSVTNNYPITTEGGFYVTGTNGMGYKLLKGMLVKASSTSNQSIRIADMGDYNILGVVYEDTLPAGTCKIVVSGMVYIYFNSNGATRGDYLRISKSGDTANEDRGKAQSSFTRPDALFLKGFVHETIAGEGLALCTLLR